LVWNQRHGSGTVSGGVDVVVQAASAVGTHGLVVPVGLLRAPRSRGF
jgi:hypothetical protein